MKTSCPSCKEEIHVHAKKCPYCHYNFSNPQYQQSIVWQKTAKKYWFYFCIIVGVFVFISNNILTSLITFIVLLMAGLFAFKKLVKLFNFFK